MKSTLASFILHPNRIIVAIMVIAIFSSCTGVRNEKNVDQIESGLNIIKRAARFVVSKKNGYTELIISNPWQGASNIEQKYILVSRGAVLPEGIDTLTVIRVPVKKIVCMSASHVAMISALGETQSVCGISGINLVFDQSLQKRISEDSVKEVGYDSGINKELLLRLSPDLVMIYGIDNQSEAYIEKIREMGLKVLYNADYLEKDPLARSEWIKLFGALYCKESLSDSIYNNEVAEYNKLKATIFSMVTKRPQIMLGLPFRDTWYVSPGNSYIARLIEDAGGEYIWADKKSELSMPMGIENVYMRAVNADFWLNTGSAGSKEEISGIDPRLAELPCFIRGNLFNNNKSVTDKGANDYWERGMLYPHLILSDMAGIFHSDKFSRDELMFYRRIDK